MGGRWFESLIFISIQGADKRMVVDRQKIITRSESRRYRVACRLEVRAGSMVMLAGSESRQARVKTGRTSKNRENEKVGTWSNTLVDLTKQDILAQTERNTGINTQGIMGKIGDTWRGWRQVDR
jgi:hypothetical protein